MEGLVVYAGCLNTGQIVWGRHVRAGGSAVRDHLGATPRSRHTRRGRLRRAKGLWELRAALQTSHPHGQLLPAREPGEGPVTPHPRGCAAAASVKSGPTPESSLKRPESPFTATSLIAVVLRRVRRPHADTGSGDIHGAHVGDLREGPASAMTPNCAALSLQKQKQLLNKPFCQEGRKERNLGAFPLLKPLPPPGGNMLLSAAQRTPGRPPATTTATRALSLASVTALCTLWAGEGTAALSCDRLPRAPARQPPSRAHRVLGVPLGDGTLSHDFSELRTKIPRPWRQCCSRGPAAGPH